MQRLQKRMGQRINDNFCEKWSLINFEMFEYLKIKLCPNVPWAVSQGNAKRIEANMAALFGKRRFEEARRSDQQSTLHKKATEL